MGRNHRYVYYEADAFFNFANPFVDAHAEDPSMSTVTQTLGSWDLNSKHFTLMH